DADTLMGQPATPCRSARPRRRPGAGRYRRLFLQFAVERRLGEKSTSRLQDLVGSAQFFVLSFQRLHAFAFAAGHAITHAAVDLAALDPIEQRSRYATDLRRYGLNSRP